MTAVSFNTQCNENLVFVAFALLDEHEYSRKSISVQWFIYFWSEYKS